MVRTSVCGRGWVHASLLALLLCAVAVPTLAKTVFVEAIGGFDAALVNEARPYVAAWVDSTGHQLTSVRDGAAYRVRLVITEAQASRPFNWWVLLFPLWPIIPVTTVEASVVLSLTVVDSSGQEVYTNTAGGEASAFLFADFLTKKSVKADAFEEAFRRVIVSAYLP